MSIVKDLVLLFVFIVLFVLRDKYWKNEIIKQKEYFIKILEHDLRIPVIAQIRGLDLILKSQSFTKVKQELLCEINKSCKYTLDMITTLSGLYKIESGDDYLDCKEINISDIFQNICNEYSGFALVKNVNLSYIDYGYTILADKEKLTKVFKILIYTAIQYAKENTDINIYSNIVSGKFYSNLIYYGEPISYDEKRRLFSLNPIFSTIGHGIQMYFCKKIADLHGGKITFKVGDKNINTFELCIPCVARSQLIQCIQAC